MKLAKLLIEKGADINIRDNNGGTALQYTVKHEYEEMVKLLKENGAAE